MQILADFKAGTFTLVPQTRSERRARTKLLAVLGLGSKLMYGGKADGEKYGLHFTFGGAYKQVPLEGSSTASVGTYVGGTDLVVAVEDAESREAIHAMRDMCFHATGGLTFLRERRVGRARAMVFTGAFCVSCSCPIIGLAAARGNRVCSLCAESCVHAYEQTAFLTPAFGALLANVCTKCHRMSPEAVARARAVPNLTRLAEVQAYLKDRGVNATLYAGKAGDPVNFTVDELVALRDHGEVPAEFRELAAHDAETQSVFTELRQELQTAA